jgi:hypothetical protein
MNIPIITLEAVSLTISIFLAYLALRMLNMLQVLTLRGGKISKSWTYILTGYLSISVGLTALILQNILALSFLHITGTTTMTLGGAFITIGIYHEYRIWKSTLSK